MPSLPSPCDIVYAETANMWTSLRLLILGKVFLMEEMSRLDRVDAEELMESLSPKQS